MHRFRQRILFAAVMGATLAGQLPVAAGDAPLSLDDIKQMRRERLSHLRIVEAIKDRGLSVEIDASTARKLRGYGFSRRQIEDIKQVAAAAAPPPIADRVKPADEPAEPRPLELDPATEALFAATRGQIDRMIAASETQLARHPAAHVTLVANKAVAARFAPDVARLDTLVKKRFPDSISSSVDRRAANIALLATRYEYEKWVRAMFKVYQQDGVQFEGQDPLASALRGNSFFVNGIFSACLEKMSRDEVRRRIAFATGFQYMRQLSRYRAPDALATGFGDLAETMMFGQPSVMVKSGYIDRELAGAGNPWAQTVKQRFSRRQIGSIQNVLAYSSSSMEVPQYAEAWSLTSLLAGDAERFARVVAELKVTDSPWQLISATYGVDEKTLLAKWYKFANAQR